MLDQREPGRLCRKGQIEPGPRLSPWVGGAVRLPLQASAVTSRLTGLLPLSACHDVLEPSGSCPDGEAPLCLFWRPRRLRDRSALSFDPNADRIGVRADSGSVVTRRGAAPTPDSRAAGRRAPRFAPVARRGSGRSRHANPRRQTHPEARASLQARFQAVARVQK
jgi:hypothetical protein